MSSITTEAGVPAAETFGKQQEILEESTNGQAARNLPIDPKQVSPLVFKDPLDSGDDADAPRPLASPQRLTRQVAEEQQRLYENCRASYETAINSIDKNVNYVNNHWLPYLKRHSTALLCEPPSFPDLDGVVRNRYPPLTELEATHLANIYALLETDERHATAKVQQWRTWRSQLHFFLERQRLQGQIESTPPRWAKKRRMAPASILISSARTIAGRDITSSPLAAPLVASPSTENRPGSSPGQTTRAGPNSAAARFDFPKLVPSPLCAWAGSTAVKTEESPMSARRTSQIVQSQDVQPQNVTARPVESKMSQSENVDTRMAQSRDAAMQALSRSAGLEATLEEIKPSIQFGRDALQCMTTQTPGNVSSSLEPLSSAPRIKATSRIPDELVPPRSPLKRSRTMQGTDFRSLPSNRVNDLRKTNSNPSLSDDSTRDHLYHNATTRDIIAMARLQRREEADRIRAERTPQRDRTSVNANSARSAEIGSSRKKDVRQRMLASTCVECDNYYQATAHGTSSRRVCHHNRATFSTRSPLNHISRRAQEDTNKRLQTMGRHRSFAPVEPDPPAFWKMGFPSTQEAAEVNRQAEEQRQLKRQHGA
ncbi:DNA endonuclease activator Ctp1 domain-containing protein [Microbotryomycetes sp. JL221]|nr:DNA endonuclease activator Ctp1 domain-containing protein [Microbotryomycetes sp. JL221]